MKKEKVSLWGYIDRTGNYVIEPQFLEALNFSEGLAVARTDILRAI